MLKSNSIKFLRNVALTSLAILPFFTSAQPYLGLNLGFGVSDHVYHSDIGNLDLSPNTSSIIWGGVAGYQFTEHWGAELEYRQYRMHNEVSAIKVATTDNNKQAWESKGTAKQTSFIPMYFYPLNDQWRVKSGIGISYTHYDFQIRTNETQTTTTHSSSQNYWGGIASLGLEFTVNDQLTLGITSQYQADQATKTASLSLSSSYYF
ncbi:MULTISPECIES: AcfA family outer membrane beta-barrel protein [Vibrio]|uniref:AcfA family outer membrane beta-barrel protein n=1 Tax=Vibrio algicola TaxID=2662262 RepID=A0A5Q0TK60_9VIBR|nr:MULTISPECIES: AcfA family outer membrane beta-barrel protein [Vibrio]MBD1576054.1 porin family protein [Vibrio sp. S11_S32]